jgi:hypothetical protein
VRTGGTAWVLLSVAFVCAAPTWVTEALAAAEAPAPAPDPEAAPPSAPVEIAAAERRAADQRL